MLYPKVESAAGWMDLSEIAAHGDQVYIVERGNQHDFRAVTKKIYRSPLARPADTFGWRAADCQQGRGA